ncbi:MAG: hypothetical protein HYY21_07000 [Candidatus Tectomicrobia bacterium]|nr:hypothetical protein [Candidatus Tectomicrobia bacterium]
MNPKACGRVDAHGRRRSAWGVGVRLAACLAAALAAGSCAAKTDEIVEPLWYYRVRKPASPWVPGPGKSAFADVGLKADYFFHNPFTGGVMAIRAHPLSFRYKNFEISDHALRIYRKMLEGWGNNVRAIKDSRFLPLGEAWSVGTWEGHPRLEFQLRGSLSRPMIDEEAERKRIEEEILSGKEEERFGPETREMRRKRIDLEKSRAQTARGARGKFVLILKRGWPADVLYEFAILDHELAFPSTVKEFDQVMGSFRLLR